MIGQRRPPKGVRYLSAGVRACDEDVIQSPVAVVGPIVLRLPPADAHSFLTSSRGQQNIHEPERQSQRKCISRKDTERFSFRPVVSGVVRPLVPGLGVEVVEDLCQQVPVDASVQAVLQQDALVPVAGWDHAAVHEVELDELCVGQVEVDGR